MSGINSHVIFQLFVIDVKEWKLVTLGFWGCQRQFLKILLLTARPAWSQFFHKLENVLQELWITLGNVGI